MGDYDRTLKLLVDADPTAFARFILSQRQRTQGQAMPYAAIKSVTQLNTEFQGDDTEADGLLHIDCENGFRYLMQIEVQSARHSYMPLRQLDYCVRAKIKHWKEYAEIPIMAVVIYLFRDGNVQEPPYCWPFLDQTTMAFQYQCIKMWELEREELPIPDQPALWPLSLLTKGRVDTILCTEMFETLKASKLYNVLPIGHTIASWLLQGDDLKWLHKEYQKMFDLFKDAPAVQWMTESVLERGRAEGILLGKEEGIALGKEEGIALGKEEGIALGKEEGIALGKEEGIALGKEEGIALGKEETSRNMLIRMVEQRFPDLRVLAEQQARLINKPERLEDLVLQVAVAQDANAVRKLLSEAVEH